MIDWIFWVIFIALILDFALFVILVVKFWKMCSDVRDIKQHIVQTKIEQSETKDRHTPPSAPVHPFRVGDTVIYPPTRKVMVVGDVFEDGSVNCYAPGGEFSGVFDASDLRKAD